MREINGRQDGTLARAAWLESWPPSAGHDPSDPEEALLRRADAAGGDGVADGRLRLDAQGNPRLTPSQRDRWGFAPGAEFLAEETPEGLLLRRADPALGKVYVEPTSECNLRCRTCVRRSWTEPTGFLSLGTYERLVAGLRGFPTLRSVAFWGFGEPLLHPSIVRMIALAKDLGVQTELITNALLLDEEMARALVRAGLDRLVVSVDGTSPRTQADVRSGADLEQVLANVRGLQRVRESLGSENPEVGLEFVVMRSNVRELPGLRRLASSIGASFVVVTNVLPYTPELADEVLYGHWAGRAYLERARWRPKVVLPRIDARHDAVEPIVGLLEHAGAVGPSRPSPYGGDGYCRFVAEGSIAVGWDGRVSPCVALMHSYTCYVLGREKAIRRYVVGDLSSEDVRDVWAREEYVRFRARVLRFEFAPCTSCGSCNLAETNEEDCFGNPFPVCGDCLWAKGVVQCP